MCSSGTCSLQHLRSIPSSPAFHISSLSLSLSRSLSFQGAYRCLILAIKISPQFFTVEYVMPFNFSHALKVTLPFFPLSLAFLTTHTKHIYSFCSIVPTAVHRTIIMEYGMNCPWHFRCVTTRQNNKHTSSHMLWLYSMSLKINCINKTVNTFKLTDFHCGLKRKSHNGPSGLKGLSTRGCATAT